MSVRVIFVTSDGELLEVAPAYYCIEDAARGLKNNALDKLAQQHCKGRTVTVEEIRLKLSKPIEVGPSEESDAN